MSGKTGFAYHLYFSAFEFPTCSHLGLHDVIWAFAQLFHTKDALLPKNSDNQNDVTKSKMAERRKFKSENRR